MIAFLLLSGKEISLPDGVSTGIIGLFFGLICGLFYYQHYLKPYYWAFSLAAGLVFTVLSHSIFLGHFVADDSSAMRLTIASFAVPFLLTLAVNHGLYRLKQRKRSKRLRRRVESHFFDINAIANPPTETRKDSAA